MLGIRGTIDNGKNGGNQMNNDEVMEAIRGKAYIPDKIVDWILDNYRGVCTDKLRDDEYSGVKWRRVCREGSDWKYGSFFICPEKMLRRGVTFDEFYGNGTVD